MLEIELNDLGMDDIELDEKGTLYASLPGEGCGDTVIGYIR